MVLISHLKQFQRAFIVIPYILSYYRIMLVGCKKGRTVYEQGHFRDIKGNISRGM